MDSNPFRGEYYTPKFKSRFEDSSDDNISDSEFTRFHGADHVHQSYLPPLPPATSRPLTSKPQRALSHTGLPEKKGTNHFEASDAPTDVSPKPLEGRERTGRPQKTYNFLRKRKAHGARSEYLPKTPPQTDTSFSSLPHSQSSANTLDIRSLRLEERPLDQQVRADRNEPRVDDIVPIITRPSQVHNDIQATPVSPVQERISSPRNSTLSTPPISPLILKQNETGKDASLPPSRTRLVVSIDFGTTFSGASYALVHPGDDPEHADIIPISNWISDLPDDRDSKKVPTQIAYASDSLKTPHWGFDIPESLHTATIRWFKLLLEPDKSHVTKSFEDVIDPDFTQNQLKAYGLDSIKVASDYVRLLWEHIRQQIIDQHDEATFDYAKKSIVMSVPAVWSEKAKHNTYLVAVNAGLAHQDYELNIVAEPEAAAVAVLKERSRLIKKDEIYIIVDAGGGTVDLTTYAVKELKPLTLAEQIPGDGDICGASFLSFNFRKLLRTYLGDTEMGRVSREQPQSEARISRDFENGLRKRFDGTDARTWNVAVPGIPDNAAPNIQGNIMKFTAQELNPVFLPVLEKVERLVRRQVAALSKQDKTAKAILLVGGFGTNHYMFKRLQAIYDRIDSPEFRGQRITVSQPGNGWQSVANGAVRCEILGLGSLVPLRIARYNIGILTADVFQQDRHYPEQKYASEFSGLPLARNTLRWCLRRGDTLVNGKNVSFKLEYSMWECDIDQEIDEASHTGDTARIKSHIELVTSQEDNPPMHHTTRQTRYFVNFAATWDLAKIPKDELPLRTSSDGRQYRHLHWIIHIRQTGAGIDITYSIGNTYVGSATHVNFHSLDNVGELVDPNIPDYVLES